MWDVIVVGDVLVGLWYWVDVVSFGYGWVYEMLVDGGVVDFGCVWIGVFGFGYDEGCVWYWFDFVCDY